jgi:predicted flap endonuclease-1-like 5' DNA nuclease
MGIFDTLLSLLGLGDSSNDADRRERETTVSVERETDAGTGIDETRAAGPDAAASTESLVDGAEGSADPAEAVETELGETVDIADAEGSTTEPDDDPESVEVIKGIGPAYAERLSNAGVDSVSELAAADAADLAAAVDLSETRVGRWIDRARDR